MDHPAFSEAGQAAGIEIWTIDKFEPVPIENKMYGKFYNGDSYIVLKTNEKGSSLTYDAHFWLGSETSNDKKGTAAILTVTLDDMLGGRAVHHREVQNHESSTFLGYFRPAIRYIEGGLESGFNQVETNAGAEKRLLRLSGCDNMRIEEVPPESSSLTRDLCYILEKDHDIFVLMPDTAKATQRRKIISIANSLRDDYHNGRAVIEIIDEFSPDEDVERFFEALGSGSKDELEDGSTTEILPRNGTTVYLYKLRIGDQVELEELNKPFKQRHLSSDSIYILDTPDSGLYVWIGAEVDEGHKKKYHEHIQTYLDDKGYPSWVHATRVSEGNECSSFKQYFTNWDVTSAVAAYASEIDSAYESGDDSAAYAKLIGQRAVASSLTINDNEGDVTMTKISGGVIEDATEIFEAPVIYLYSRDLYIVKCKYENENGEEAYVLYKWKGAHASDDDKQLAYDKMKELEEEIEGNVITVEIPQGKEIKHFLKLFKGNLIVFYGDKSTSVNANNEEDETGVLLFRVEGTEPSVDMRAVQVDKTPDTLTDDGVFVLETTSTLYVWLGKESDPKQQEEATNKLVTILNKEQDIVTFHQGEEPEEFWDALGGKPDEKEDNVCWKSTVSRRVNAQISLYAVTVRVNRKILFEEIPMFSQEDLSDDGVYILDTGEELYYWKGVNIPERVKQAKDSIIEDYVSDDGLDRTVDNAVIVSLVQGNEPKSFKKNFPVWNDDMWTEQISYEDIKSEVKAGNTTE